MNKTITFTLIAIMALVAGKIFFSAKQLEAVEKVRCSQFETQEIAQYVFASDKKTYAWMDRNHDGVACQHLPANISVK